MALAGPAGSGFISILSPPTDRSGLGSRLSFLTWCVGCLDAFSQGTIDAFFECFKADSPFWSAHHGVEDSRAAYLRMCGALLAFLVPCYVLALGAPIREPIFLQIWVVDTELPRHSLDASRGWCLLAGDVWEGSGRICLASR